MNTSQSVKMVVFLTIQEFVLRMTNSFVEFDKYFKTVQELAPKKVIGNDERSK